MSTLVLGFGISSFYHLFLCTSKENYSYYMKLDYVGILIMGFGEAVCPLYYGFMCPEKKFY